MFVKIAKKTLKINYIHKNTAYKSCMLNYNDKTTLINGCNFLNARLMQS